MLAPASAQWHPFPPGWPASFAGPTRHVTSLLGLKQELVTPLLLSCRAPLSESAQAAAVVYQSRTAAATAAQDTEFLVPESTNFVDLGLSQNVAKALENAGFSQPAQVQVKADRPIHVTGALSSHAHGNASWCSL